MDKKDWIKVANNQQQQNMGFRGLTPDQQKAVIKLNQVLPEFLWELDECKDVGYLLLGSLKAPCTI